MNMQKPGRFLPPRRAERPTYFIAGATGNVGRHLVPELLWNGHHVRALTRKPGQANLPPQTQLIGGDLTRIETFEQALKGVSGLHLITIGGDDYEPLRNGQAIIAAAVRAGVKRVTVLSDGRNGSVETAVRSSDLEWTILQPVELMSNMLGWAHSVRTENIVRGPSGDSSRTMIHESDVASAAAQILMHGGYRNEICRLTGPQALTMHHKVAMLNAVLGRAVRHVEVSEDHTRDMMRRLGMREDVIDYVIAWDSNPPAEARAPNHVFENIVRRPASTIAEWFAENRSAFELSSVPLHDQNNNASPDPAPAGEKRLEDKPA